MSEFFYGEYHHQIDEKNRLRVPSKLKDLLGDEPFITLGADGCLLVLKKDDANRIFENSFGAVTFADINQHLPLRMMSSKGYTAEEDKYGRILLPKHLVEYAELKKDVVTIGAYHYVEIWSKEKWEKYSALDDEKFKESLKAISGVKPETENQR